MRRGELRDARTNEGVITPKTPTKSYGRISLIGNILAAGLESSTMPMGNTGIIHASVTLLGDTSIVGVHNIK